MTEIDTRGFSADVFSYSPITTPGVEWKARERRGNVRIRRYAWFGKTLLHKIEKNPLLDFLYVTPYLLLRVFWACLLHPRRYGLVHAHGFNAALIGCVLKKVFGYRLVVSTHAVYELPRESRASGLIVGILRRADHVLALSDASIRELESWGLSRERLGRYTYWIDLEQFTPEGPRAQWLEASDTAFNVLFVGRLTAKKGVPQLLEVARRLPNVGFVFVGNGPLEAEVAAAADRMPNVRFLGRVPNDSLAEHYRAASLFCIPSQYEEGFGRVVMEAVACGLPVVGADKGGIPEALDPTVSVLMDPTVDNLERAIDTLHGDADAYQALRDNCRTYAEGHFSRANFGTISGRYAQLGVEPARESR